MTAPSPQAVRFAAVELTWTGRDLSDRGRAGVSAASRGVSAPPRLRHDRAVTSPRPSRGERL